MISCIVFIIIGYDGGSCQVEMMQIRHLVAYHHDVIAVDGTRHLQRYHLVEFFLGNHILQPRLLLLRSHGDIIIRFVAHRQYLVFIVAPSRCIPIGIHRTFWHTDDNILPKSIGSQCSRSRRCKRDVSRLCKAVIANTC